jgi:hypothetical protein
MVIHEFMRSPGWNSLREKTRFSYQRALQVLKPLDNMPLHKIDRPFVFRLRDEKILPKQGAWMANYVVTVMRLLLASPTIVDGSRRTRFQSESKRSKPPGTAGAPIGRGPQKNAASCLSGLRRNWPYRSPSQCSAACARPTSCPSL